MVLLAMHVCSTRTRHPSKQKAFCNAAAQELQQALAFSGAQNQQEKQRQARKKLICLVGQSEAQMCAGAAAAAAAACQYTAVLQGGLAAFEAADLAQVRRCVYSRSALVQLQVRSGCCTCSVVHTTGRPRLALHMDCMGAGRGAAHRQACTGASAGQGL